MTWVETAIDLSVNLSNNFSFSSCNLCGKHHSLQINVLVQITKVQPEGTNSNQNMVKSKREENLNQCITFFQFFLKFLGNRRRINCALNRFWHWRRYVLRLQGISCSCCVRSNGFTYLWFQVCNFSLHYFEMKNMRIIWHVQRSQQFQNQLP